MKVTKKVLSLLLVGIMVMACLTGCGGKGSSGGKGGKGTKDIEIRLLRQGLGNAWLDALIEGFKEKYPEYNVTYSETASTTALEATFGLEKTDTYDLYFGTRIYDVTYAETLNDILGTTIDGESKTIKEKFKASYLAMEEVDGNYYALTYGGGIVGFVYNKKLFDKAEIKQLPRTTDELLLVCDMLKDAKITPICHFQSDGYNSYINETWWAQYDGVDAWNDFYVNPSKDKFMKDDGRYEAIKVQEKLSTPENVLLGSNSDQHVAMQTKFLEEKAAIMLNGSWLSSEMKNSDKMNDFAMMKTPVISSITDKLTTVKTDPELRKLITAIDNVTDGTESEDVYKDGDNYKVNGKSVSKADWDYVRTARNMMLANYTGQVAYIPTYSNAKEGAKEFLKYMYSDEGYKVYMDALHVTLPFTLDSGEPDISKWNAFEQNQAELFAGVETVISELRMDKHELFINGGASAYCNEVFVNKLSTKSEQDRKSAEEIWKNIKKIIDERYDAHWMLNIK